MTKKLIIDVSSYQGIVDWDCMTQTDIDGVYIRSGISWGYQDSKFDFNWTESKRVGIPRGIYHVLYPGQGAQRQFDNLLRIMDGHDVGEMPIMLDCERDLGQTKTTITNEIIRFGELVFKEYGRMMGIYSRRSWMEAYTLKGLWRKIYDYWLAQYLSSGIEHPGPVALPDGVDRSQVVLHQTTDKGTPFCIQSKALDYNRWQLSDEAWNEFIGLEEQPPTTPPTGCKWDEERIYALERDILALSGKVGELETRMNGATAETNLKI